jgi:uncharacterized protein DUF4020
VNRNQLNARFRLSQLLNRLAPESAVTSRFAAAEKAAHPDFDEGDRDGFLARIEMGSGGDDPSPIEADQMVSWSAAEAMHRLTTALQEAEAREPYSLLGAVQQAAKAHPAWAIDLFTVASASGAPDGSARVVEAIGWGLREATAPTDDQIRFLRLCAELEWPAGAAHALSLAVEQWTHELPDNTPSELLDAFDRAADVLFRRSTDLGSGLLSERGWFDRAINHPAGRAAQIWWRVAEARDRSSGEFVLSLDDDERRRWERVVADTSAAGAFARPILGQAIERLSAGDHPWATVAIYPAFDADINAEHAAQVWEGRLMQQRWSWTVVASLDPYWSSFLERSAVLVPRAARQLGDAMAMFVVHARLTGFTLDRIHRFIRHAAPEARLAFADAIPRHLKRLTPDDRRAIWSGLLRQYWRDRRTNVPLPLGADEAREMISWITALPETCGEAVAELEQTESPAMQYADAILWHWRQDDSWIREHPLEAAAIIKFIALRGTLQPWSIDDAVRVLKTAAESGAPTQVIIDVAECIAAASGGVPRQALDLIQSLREGASDRDG